MRKIIYLAAAAGALFLVISCASTPPQQPKPETPQPQAVQPVQPAAAAPDAELAQAKGLQQRVDALGLGTYDPDDYAAANKDLQAGQDSYGKDNAASKKSLQAAITEYNAVISKGGPLYLAKLQEQTEASKKAADDLKASVAVKDDYATANGVYKKALQEKDAGDIENAGKDFVQAGTTSTPWRRSPSRRRTLPSRRSRARSRTRQPREQKAAGRGESPEGRGLLRRRAAGSRGERNMKTRILVIAGIALLLGSAAVPLVAQSLLDNEYYHKAQDLLTQSQQALDAGDYDNSASLASQAHDYAREVGRLRGHDDPVLPGQRVPLDCKGPRRLCEVHRRRHELQDRL